MDWNLPQLSYRATRGEWIASLMGLAGFFGGLWALEYVTDPAAGYVVLYASFCALVAPSLIVRLR